MTTRFDEDDDPEFGSIHPTTPGHDPDDPLLVLLGPAPAYLGAPPGRYEEIRRTAVRRRRIRTAAGVGMVCAVAGLIALPLNLMTSHSPRSPTVPQAPPISTSPSTPPPTARPRLPHRSRPMSPVPAPKPPTPPPPPPRRARRPPRSRQWPPPRLRRIRPRQRSCRRRAWPGPRRHRTALWRRKSTNRTPTVTGGRTSPDVRTAADSARRRTSNPAPRPSGSRRAPGQATPMRGDVVARWV